jgi:hypothetical protein
VYKKGDKLDWENYRGICLLNVTYKVFANIIYDHLLPHDNAAVQHSQDGFQSGKSTTDQFFALRQILEKCNEFNITTHHLFIFSRQTKITIHKTLIHPVLLYGSETWVLTKMEENQLPVFERKALRTISGPKIKNGVCRRRYNHELDTEFNSPNTLNVTKTSRSHYIFLLFV